MNAASAAAALASCAASQMPRLRLPCLIPATSGKAPAAGRNSGTNRGYLRTVAAQPPLNHAGQSAWRHGFPPDHSATPVTWPYASLTGPKSCGSGISGRSLRTRPGTHSHHV
jgi:hypothetical protein